MNKNSKKQSKNNNKSCSLSKLNCVIEDYSSEILDLVNAESKGDLYVKFVQKFLTYIPIDYRPKDQICSFGDFTDEAFKFFQKRPELARKIEISQTTYKGSPAITILTLCDNKPFIIDSLNCLISRLGLHTIFIFHPVIPSVRSNRGVLKDITDKGEGVNRESLIFIKAHGVFDKKTTESIKEEINNIINLVDYTYNSWQPLLNKLINITTHIINNKEIYDEHNLHADENLDFLNWLQKNNFTFLAMLDYDVATKKLSDQKGLRQVWQNNVDEIKKIIEFSTTDYYSQRLAMLGKINKLSPVHRNTLVDYILIKHVDIHGNYRSGTIIFGLYGTAIYFQSIKTVPILRGKLNYVIDKSGFPPSGYYAKKLKNIVESLPREFLIRIDEEDLHCMCVHMLSSMRSHKLKLFVHTDWANSFVSVVIFMPRERLSPEAYKTITNYLSEQFGCKIIADDITVVAQDFAHLFVTLPVKDKQKLTSSFEKMEKDLIEITTNWSEALHDKLCEKYGEYEGSLIFKDVELIFPNSYIHKYDAVTTIEDIDYLKNASQEKRIYFNLVQEDSTHFTLKIYSAEKYLALSDLLPAIENIGFYAIEEESFSFKEAKNIKRSWIYAFKLSSPIEITNSFTLLKNNVEESLYKISQGLLTSDILNKLLVLAGFGWRRVKLLKALARYMHQTGFTYGKGYVQLTLIKHYEFAESLVELFESRFDPKNHSKKKEANIHKTLNNYLDSVESSAEDKVLRNLYLIITAISRTNYYQHDNGIIKQYLSFKFDSSKVPDLPVPIPYAEIFVYSNDMEGIHIRGGKVARGGLRWSDRKEDYRMEVFGLVKAQMTKNTVIVPVGSKGIFTLNFEQDGLGREEYMQKAISSYQNFLRGLLDVTDNLVDDKIVHPENTVIYDEDDPYLVVAADKGTATFSDYANEVSKEYNFWLGDAFASGGSVGYDHKKMGITAKGAWISVQTHFMARGIDIQKEPFTVAGIGDMSGDVFGNGMLLSKYIKLVAAFNHRHIFIDPNPDIAKSYKERQRLFKVPRSSWTDYNSRLISKGGGIFDRSSKSITISKEIQQLLGITCNTITPDELIKTILKANVDLIWNGGIGTYIKATNENNVDIGDKANDNVRCNGNDIRARVIGEGGNLGISQLGRIEYALKGGSINTDFIDNSAGVDCSDHEVNIKIALNHAYFAKKISLKQRNEILEKMTKEVEDLVLVDNHNQNQAISIAQLSPIMNIDTFSQLIRELEQKKLLDREVEFLPDKTELSRRALSKESMTRPELSVLLSYSKMYVDFELSTATLIKDKFFTDYLFNYFPATMQKKFKKEIENHPLRQEIIRTVIINKMVNQLGGPLLSAIKRETGGAFCDITRAYTTVCTIFDLDNLWDRVDKLGVNVDINIKIGMYGDLSKIMRRGISWFVKNIEYPIDISSTIKEYSKPTQQLAKIVSKFLVGEIKDRYENMKLKYIDGGVDEDLASAISTLEILVSAFDIIHIAKQTGAKDTDVANLYFNIGDKLNIDWLRKLCDYQIDESYWNRLSIQSLKDDLYDKQRRLVIKIVKQSLKKKIDLDSWLTNKNHVANIFTNFIHDVKLQENININMIILANKKFEMFLRQLN
ncbi:MAG: NAD-glutamate dehydrogenase [Rickettsiaceae bacterium]|nr:NAD-glutamate dehydrogenase [Rickettsiaceae bacterium]